MKLYSQVFKAFFRSLNMGPKARGKKQKPAPLPVRKVALEIIVFLSLIFFVFFFVSKQSMKKKKKQGEVKIEIF